MNKKIEKYLDKVFGANLLDDLRLVLDSGVNLLDLLNTKTIRHPESEINFRKPPPPKRKPGGHAQSWAAPRKKSCESRGGDL